MLTYIAKQFAIEGRIENILPLGEGFINDSYIVRTTGDTPDYLLQRKNHLVFPNVPAMMDNIVRVCNHMKHKISSYGGDPLRESLTPIPSVNGDWFFADTQGNYWALCLYIPSTITYQTAPTEALAMAGGRGIGRFQKMLADFTEPLYDTIEGFHNIRFRLQQWDKAVAADAAGRCAETEREREWIESRREKMLEFWTLKEKGILPERVTHNDTKISNILFDEASGRELCMIDLDTVMKSTCLNDFGDAIRSYTNTAAEDEKDLSRVKMSLPLFEAYTKGYLSFAGSFLKSAEIENLAFSALYITYEQVLRFLMDYLNGDTYYKTKYSGHNLVRTRAQYALLQSMEANFDKMREISQNPSIRG